MIEIPKPLPPQGVINPELHDAVADLISRLPPFDIKPRLFGEIDSYGANWMLARRLGLHAPLSTYSTILWNHGVYDVCRLHNDPRELCGVFNYNFPNAGRDTTILVDTKERESLLHGFGFRKALAVGLPFAYIEDAESVERIPGSLLVMGNHSTPWCSIFDPKANPVDGRSTNLAFPQQVTALRERFTQITACVGFTDVQAGNWIAAYEHNKIPWITGAGINDANALLRMSRIFRSFEYVATNSAGSHIFYALYHGCKVFWYGENVDAPHAVVSRIDPRPFQRTEAERLTRIQHCKTNFRSLFSFLFVDPDDAVSRPDIGAAIIGAENKLSPEAVATLLGWRVRSVTVGQFKLVNAYDVYTFEDLHGVFEEAVRAQDTDQLDKIVDSYAYRGTVPPNACLKVADVYRQRGNLARANHYLESERRWHPKSGNLLRAERMLRQASAKQRLEDIGIAKTVLFLAHGPNQVNGPNCWLMRLLPELKHRGWTPRVLMIMTHEADCAVARALREADVEVDTIPTGFTEDLMHSIGQCMRRRPCTVFVPNLDVPGYFLSEYIRRAGIATVGVLHSDDAFHNDLISAFMDGQGSRFLDATVIVSSFQERTLLERSGTMPRIVRIPYGAPIPDLKATYQRKPFRFVYAGRLVEEQKRISETVTAMVRILKRFEQTEFLICGDGPARPTVRQIIAESGLGERIRLLGALSSKELQIIYLNCQAFVLMSDYEGLSISLQEAMGAGLVPLCTSVRSGSTELVRDGNNGFLLANRSDALDSAVEGIIDDPETWERLSSAARETIRVGYSVQVNADGWARLLSELATARSGGKDGALTSEVPVLEIPAVPPLPPVRADPKGMAREDRRRPGSESTTEPATPAHPFLNPLRGPDNADLYWVRKSILGALRNALPELRGTFLDIGCGVMPYRSLIEPRVARYIGMDIETEIYRAPVDLRWDGKRIPLPDASIDSAMATEVLEHCPDPAIVLRETRRVLKPEGCFFFTVPFIWPLHDAPYDFFRYTPFALEKLLLEAGFTQISIRPLGGWNASLAQMIGLWLKRAPMPEQERNAMAAKLWPFYCHLLKSDRPSPDPKAGNTMATGWSGVAFAPASPCRTVDLPSVTVERGLLDQPVCLVRSHRFNYSETFIEDHITGVSTNMQVVYGFPWPMLRSAEEAAVDVQTIQAMQEAVDDTARMQAYSCGMAAYLRRSKARVVLAESGLMGARVYRACRAACVPLVVHFHGIDAYGRSLLQALRPEFPALFATAAAIIVVSKAMRDQVLSLGAPESKVVLSPYGVDLNVAQRADPATAGPRFLAVGRFVEKKAPERTLEAFAKVHSVVPDAHLTMVGDGPLFEQSVELAATLGITSAVTFAGVMSREKVSQLMAASRCFVQHSVTAADGDSEGLPLAVLEAGAHGLPVVATVHAGIPDAVRTGIDGFLVNENDVDAMARAMTTIARDADLAAAMGKNYRDRIVAEFGREKSLARLRCILNAVASSMAPKSGSDAARALWSEHSRHDVSQRCRKAIALDRNFLPAYVTLAGELAKAGNYIDAYICLREASRVGELAGPARDLLADIRKQLPANDVKLTTYEHRIGARASEHSSSPRRILVVTNLFPPQEHGGYGRTMWEFCSCLVNRGHTVRVLSANCPALHRAMDANLPDLEPNVSRTLLLAGRWENGRAVPEPSSTEVARVFEWNRRAIQEEVGSFRPDVCLLGNIDFVGWHAIDDLVGLGIPVVHRLGNELPGFPPEATPVSDLYVLAGNTQWMNDGLKRRGYACPRFEVVYPGSPLETYFRAFPPDRTSLRIAYASIVTTYKGVQVLVDALCRLHSEGVPVRCEIAGDIVDRNLVRLLRGDLRRHGLDEAVSFIGYQNRTGLAALYARSNVLVFPSVFEEPFGKSQIEAMAAGLLVISSGTGGTREIVRDHQNGLIFKPNDPAHLADAIKSLLEHPGEWQRMADQGQNDAFKFTTLQSVLALENIFGSFRVAETVSR